MKEATERLERRGKKPNPDLFGEWNPLCVCVCVLLCALMHCWQYKWDIELLVIADAMIYWCAKYECLYDTCWDINDFICDMCWNNEDIGNEKYEASELFKCIGI